MILGCIAATWLVWGSTYLAIRFALVSFAPFYMMGTRFLIAGLLIFIWMLARGTAFPSAVAWRNGIVIGVLLMGGGVGCTAFAEQTVASGIVVSFIAVTPLLLVLLNLGFGVRPQRAELIAMSIGLIGVLMLTRGVSFQSSLGGLGAVALGCSCWSTGSILAVRKLPPAPGAAGFMTEMLGAGCALILVSLVWHEPWTLHATPAAWVAWAYLTVFGTLVAFSAYMVLLAHTPTSVASTYTYVNPVVGLLLGVSVGGEIVTPWEWMSAVIIIAAVALLFTSKIKRGRPPSAVAPER